MEVVERKAAFGCRRAVSLLKQTFEKFLKPLNSSENLLWCDGWNFTWGEFGGEKLIVFQRLLKFWSWLTTCASKFLQISSDEVVHTSSCRLWASEASESSLSTKLLTSRQSWARILRERLCFQSPIKIRVDKFYWFDRWLCIYIDFKVERWDVALTHIIYSHIRCVGEVRAAK